MRERKRNNYVKSVRLGVYGPTAERIVAALKHWVAHSCGPRLDAASFQACEINRAADNEIVLDVFNDESYERPLRSTVFAERYRPDKTDVQIRKWLAGVVKGAAKLRLGEQSTDEYRSFWLLRDLHKAEIAKHPGWRRTGDAKVAFAAPGKETEDTVFTVAECYALYEALKDRKAKDSAYPAGTAAAVVGEPFDPVRTELETFREEEMKKIDAALKDELAEISRWYSSEYRKLDAVTDAKKAAAKAKAEEAKKALNAEIDCEATMAA